MFPNLVLRHCWATRLSSLRSTNSIGSHPATAGRPPPTPLFAACFSALRYAATLQTFPNHGSGEATARRQTHTYVGPQATENSNHPSDVEVSPHQSAIVVSGESEIRSQSSQSTYETGTDQSGILLDLGDGGEQFSGASGFWPSQPSKTKDDDSKLAEVAQEEHSSLAATQWQPVSLRSRVPPRKIDLSGVDPAGRWQATHVSHTPTHVDESFGNFRTVSSTPIRAILVEYMQKVEPWIEEFRREYKRFEHSDDDLRRLAEALEQTFDTDTTQYLQNRGFDPSDVVAWGWILDSSTGDLAAKRYVAWTAVLRNNSRPGVPLSIPLQILRAQYIGTIAYGQFLACMVQQAENPAINAQHKEPLDRHPTTGTHVTDGRGADEDTTDEAVAGDTGYTTLQHEWDLTSAMLLVVRLLRHARLVAPSTLPDIAKLTSRLLFVHHRRQHVHQRLCFMANRILSLVALPANRNPFLAVPHQQAAQVSLVKAMVALKPQIPINREGYRALIRVQLVHQKTEDEKAWANAKSQKWPPWRHDKTGMDERRELFGKESRASRLLRRMQEAGFTHGDWEHQAAILTGWDIDGSPTIQTRSILPTFGSNFTNFFAAKVSPNTSSALWEARINATRSVREAWACFLSFMKDRANQSKSDSFSAYAAMFEKLFARPVTTDRQSMEHALPGDGRETFPDPLSQSELIYIESEPPNVLQLYQYMRADGINPGGRLLARLIGQAHTLRDGFGYLQDSSFDEVKKDVLRYAYKYDNDFLELKLDATPPHVVAALVNLLCRSAREGSPPFAPSRDTWRDLKSHTADPQRYALDLLRRSRCKSTLAWNNALQGVLARITGDIKSSPHNRALVRRSSVTADTIEKIIKHMKKNRLQLTFMTFRVVCDFRRLRLLPPLWHWVPQKTLSSTKDLFMQVAFDDSKVLWSDMVSSQPLVTVPSPEDLRMMVEFLGFAEDLQGLLELAEWIHKHSQELRGGFEGRRLGEQMMRMTMMVMRMFLEGQWDSMSGNDDTTSVNPEQLQQVSEWCAALGWPEAQEVEGFKADRPAYLKRLRLLKRTMRRVSANHARMQQGHRTDGVNN